MKLPRLSLTLPIRFNKGAPGRAAGIEHHEITKRPSSKQPAIVTCIDYGPEYHHVQTVSDLDAFLAEHRPAGAAVRWINVDGLGDMKAIQGLATKYRLHPLAIEDLLNINQRPKVDLYPDDQDYQARVFLITRMVQIQDMQLHSEQVSVFVGHSTVLTFQETPGDVWNPIRQRLATHGSRLRGADASFLVYAMIDAIIDHAFPVLEHFGDQLEELEDIVFEKPERETISAIHLIKRELLLLRRALWPMREVVQALMRDDHPCMSVQTRTYLRDVYDNAVQAIDIVETYREVASSLTETYMSALSNRMNEVMKVLTLIGTIFIPLTFLAGVYGMNFHFMPEYDQHWAYPAFWAICVTVAGGMFFWFKRRGWL